MIDNATRQLLNTYLAKAISHANAGNARHAHAHKQELIDLLHTCIRHPDAR